MKTRTKILLSTMVLVFAGILSIFGIFSNIETVSAEIDDKDFVKMVLVGEQNWYPYTYFDNLSQAIHTDKDIPYRNKDGELTSKYRAIKQDITGFFKSKYSEGSVTVILNGGMKELAQTGHCYIYAQAGLLAMNNEEKSKITISISTGGKTASATSNKVYQGESEYSPEWVQTEKIQLTGAEESITFSFINAEPSWAFDQAKFYIFEPTILMGMDLGEETIQVETQDQTVTNGQLIELKASTYVDNLAAQGDLIEYYKNYHKIQWEIIEGEQLGSISGSYLNVTGTAGTIKVRAKCYKNSESTEYIYSNIITFSIDNSTCALNLKSNFKNGASLYGGGVFPTSKEKTTIFTVVNEGYVFSKYVDQTGAEVPYTITGSGSYRASIDLGESKTITAILIKQIKVDEIVIKDKYYDKNDLAEVKKVVVNGIEEGHNIAVFSSLSAKFLEITPKDDIFIILSGNVQLFGEDSWMYNFDSTLPDTYGNILKRDVLITASEMEKEYGDEDPAIEYTIDDSLLAGDILSGALGREPGEELGQYQITLGTLSHPYYNLKLSTNIFTIAKKKINITNVLVPNKMYDGTNNYPQEQISVTKTGDVVNDNAILKYTAIVEDGNVGVNKLVTFSAWIEGTEKGYYEIVIDIPELRVNIIPRNITVTAVAQSKLYGEVDPSFVYEYEEEQLIEGDLFTGRLARSLGEDVGSYRIGIGTLNIPNYEINFVSAELVIHAQELTIKADNLSKVYGEDDSSLTYKITEGFVKEGIDLGIVLNRQLGENVGDYTISISSQTNMNYEITFIAGKLEIKSRYIEINISVSEKVYDGTNEASPVIQILNSVLSDGISLNLSATFADKNAGQKSVFYSKGGEIINEFSVADLDGQNKANYTIQFNVERESTILPKEIIVTLASDAIIGKTFGSTEGEISCVAEGLVNGENLVGALSRTAGENVGSYTINQGTITEENNPNYSITLNISQFFVISKRNIIISTEDSTITFGEAVPEIVYGVDDLYPLPLGVLLNDVIVGEPSREVGNNSGVYKHTIGTLRLLDSVKNNYSLTFSAGQLTILKKQVTLSIDDAVKSYGDNDPIFNYSIDSGEIYDLTDLVFIRDAGENVGGYSISAQLSENYELVVNDGTLSINAIPLTIRANNIIKTYGEADPELTFVISSGILMLNDTTGSVFHGSLEREAGETVGTYRINIGTVACSDNYILTFQQGTVTIEKKNILVTANETKKFFDEEAIPELTYNVEGLVNGDVLSGELSVPNLTALGEYEISIGTLASANYNITFVGAKYSVVKRTLNIVIDYISKEYDGTGIAEFTYSVSGDIKAGDEDLLGITLDKEAGATVGRYLITATCSNDKYIAVVTENYFEILPRKITIKADDFETIYGQEIPNSETWIYKVTGRIIDNELTINLYRTQNDSAGQYTIYGSILNANNYDVTYIPGTLTIKQREIAINVDNYEKIYGQSDPTFEYEIVNGSLVDGDSLQGTITREHIEKVGVYKLICSLSNSNYKITMNDATLTITPKDVVLIAEVLDKTYDGTDIAYVRTPTVSGFIDGDDVMFYYEIDKLARFIDKEVGDEKQVIVYGGELLGEDAKNYSIIRPTDATASITNSVISGENVSVYAGKTNTKLKVGTTLVAQEVEKEKLKDLFNNNKAIVESYNLSLMYNEESFENYGSLQVAIDLGQEKYNVQVYKVKTDGSKELVKSEYAEGVVKFDTEELGTYVIIADNDNWLNYALIAICVSFVILISGVILYKEMKKKKAQKANTETQE